MNVLQLISSGGMYGAEAVILNLCCQLRAQGHGAEIAVFNNEHAPNLALADAARAKNFRVHLIPCRGKFDPSATGKIRERLLLGNVDVLHTHGYKADLYGYLGASNLQAAKVSTCHNWCENDIYESLYGFADRFVLRHFDQVIAVSESVERRLNRAGVSRDKTRVVENGIDLTPPEEVLPTLRSELGLPETLLVGVVGRLAPEKGIQYLLEALPGVVQKYGSFKCLIIGDGPDKLKLETLSKKLGLDATVLFLGRRGDMAQVYQSLDILVQPSLDEGLPMTLLEALASKVAVVATAVGMVPRVIQDRQTGLLIPPANSRELADALILLLESASLRRELGNAGHDLVRDHFSSAKMTREYLDAYRCAMRE